MAREHTETTAKSAVGGSVLEVLAAAGALVLAIIGLTNVARYGMAGAATIVVGAALVMEGGAMLARMRADRAHGERAHIGGPAGIAVLGGIAGIVLGALSLADFAPLTLLAIAIIVFGGTLMLASIGTARVGDTSELGAGRTASGFELLAGVVATTLGILALIDIAPLVLTLIALLVVSAAVFMSGGAIGARMSRFTSEREYEERRYVEPRTTTTHHYEVGTEPRHA